MAKLRVFELAKELNMPAKQLLQTVRKMGIPVSSNFNALADSQIVVIKRKLLDSATQSEQLLSEDVERGGRRVISARRSEQVHIIQKSLEANGVSVVSKQPRRLRKANKETEEEEAVAPLPPETGTEVRVAAEAEIETVVDIEKSTAFDLPRREVVLEPEPKPVVVPEKQEIKAENETSSVVPLPKQEAPRQEKRERVPLPPKVTEESESKKQFKSKPSAESPVIVQGPEVTLKQEESPELSKEEKKPELKISEKEALKRKGKPKAKTEDELFEYDGADKRLGKDVKKVKFPRVARVEERFRSDDDMEMAPRRKSRPTKKIKEIKKVEIPKHTFNPRKKNIKVGNQITVSEFAGMIGIKVPEIIKKLMELGIMATINHAIPGETAALVASEFNIELEVGTTDIEDVLKEEKEEDEKLLTRAPIVTVMGHVDHGKTSLLDKIRSTLVTKGEAGGITQHIGAYHVETEVGNITFLDTPGHEAFTAMRARGANVTDIVVLVVAADDGVQPQTVEAIHHAQAADVPIIVAVNKIDRPDASPARIQQELLSHQLVSEDLGGSTIFVPVSAKTGEGINFLLEMIQLQAEILELKATIEGNARGIIIESKIAKGRGAVGTVLIQKGTLKVGDFFVVGNTYGRVRAMYSDHGSPLDSVGPSYPAEIVGFNEVPETGGQFIVIEDEKATRQIAASRTDRRKEEVASLQQKSHLENLFSQVSGGEPVELKLLIKADVQGSVEALQNSLAELGNDHVFVKFIHTAVGNITETDVSLASASDAIIIAFNVKPEMNAKNLAIKEGVDVRLYNVIYDAINEVKAALEGLLAPNIEEKVIGHCEIRKIYNSSKTGMILGCYVTDGKVVRNAHARVLRNNEVIHDGHILSLRRFKEDAREVVNNYECGVAIDFEGVQEGDIIEPYERIEVAATL
ncbi:translation initiation factor IF-2 [Deltaproteobacteria bacterium TL4]